jgi:hypothetical protein
MARQNVAVEVFYSGTWHDAVVDDKVFEDAPVTIRRGQGDESTALRPAQITARLDNATDKYRTTNPTSVLYGLAGRNTPVRVKVAGAIRGVAEASAWTVDETPDFRATPRRGKAWVDLQAGGMLQRVNGWTEPVSSTMVKGMLSFGSILVGAWPLEDASDATILTNIDPGGLPGRVQGVTLADSERPAGSARSAKMGAGGLMSGTFASASATAGWEISFAFKLSALPGSATYEELFTWFDSTGRRWTWEVNNTNFAWTVYATDGASVLSSVATSFGGILPGSWVRVRVKTTVAGATVTYEPSWYREGDQLLTGTTLTFGGTSTGWLTTWQINAGTYNVGAWYTGVFAISDASIPILNAGVIADFNGHNGETAGDRFARLAGDLNLAYTVLGDKSLSASMGGQPEATFADLCKEIVATDDALLFDDIDTVGLVLMLRNARYNQTPALALNITDLPYRPKEVADDQATHNVVTAAQRAGGSYTASDTTGPLGTAAPPTGVGEARQTVDVNVADEANDLLQQANWWLFRGTVNLPRYPQVMIDLNADPGLIAQVNAVDVGSVITIAGYRENTIRLYVLGWTEVIGSHTRTITYVCAPDQQFVVGVFDAATSRYDLKTSVLNAAKNSTVTAMTFKQTDDEAWSNVDVPYDIVMDGERMTVTAMGSRSGSGPWLQACTVVRSVNGVVKAQATNAPVHIATPGRYAL